MTAPKRLPVLEAHYDPIAKRWVGDDGRYTTEREAKDEMAFREVVLSTPVRRDFAPVSNRLNTIEAALNSLVAAQDARPQPMPSDIYAAMCLAEYYVNTEGDLEQTVAAPMEIGIKPLLATCSDKSIEKEAQALIEALYLDDVAQEAYYSQEVYGQAYPLEEWDGSELLAVHLLNPKLIWSPQLNSWGTSDQSLASILSKIKLAPSEYHGMGNMGEENSPMSVYPIPSSVMRPLFARKMEWQRYATPPMRRTFNTLSTRQCLNEMIRATIEGYRNQLWVFKIGSENRPAKPKEVEYLKAQIEGGAGDRTGHLVWNYDLVVEQHAPASLDAMLGNERWESLTRHIFTQRGISAHLVSGNPNQKGGADSTLDIDIQVLISRLQFRRKKMQAWITYLFGKVGEKRGWTKQPVVTFGRIALEDELLIKNRIQPLYTVGLLSVKTALEEGGYNYEAEVANKKKQDNLLFTPPATFAQMVVKPEATGQPTQPGQPNPPANKETTQSNPTMKNTGEPAAPQRNQNSPDHVQATLQLLVQAAWEDEIDQRWQEAKAQGTKEAIHNYMLWMAGMSAASLSEAYTLGHQVGGGGIAEPNQDRIKLAAGWNQSYLENMEAQMTSALDSLGTFDFRQAMYPIQGKRYAYMFGVRDAMRGNGYVGWRRILHPEQSRSGPCAACIEDSQIIHPIDDNWTDHPNGVCGQQMLAYYPSNPLATPALFSVPPGDHIVRRVGVASQGQQ